MEKSEKISLKEIISETTTPKINITTTNYKNIIINNSWIIYCL